MYFEKSEVRVELQHDPALDALVGTLHVTPPSPGLHLQHQDNTLKPLQTAVLGESQKLVVLFGAWGSRPI